MESAIRSRVGAFLASTGMTKNELAERLGISRGALYMKLHGESDFSLHEAYQLASIIGCSVNELRIDPTVTAGH